MAQIDRIYSHFFCKFLPHVQIIVSAIKQMVTQKNDKKDRTVDRGLVHE